jgi:transposase
MKLKYSAELTEKAKVLYTQQNLSTVTISEMLDVPLSSVYSWIKQAGLIRSHKQTVKKLSESKKREITALYQSGLTQKHVAKKLCVSQISVSRIVREFGISKDKRKRIPKYKKEGRYSRFFPLTRSKAWFVGILFGDGHLNDKGNTVQVTSGDMDILKNVRKILNVRTKTQYSKTSEAKALRIHSSELHKQLLSRFHLPSRKSDRLVFPELDKSFIPHFIRGFFDADGGWYVDPKAGYLYMNINSTSSDFINQIFNIVRDVEGVETKGRVHKVNRKTEPDKKPIYRIVLCGKDALMFGEWIYKDSTLFNRCRRKYEIWRRYADKKSAP